nr:unnamed protein product [Spirometra erinaceieuropaei]
MFDAGLVILAGTIRPLSGCCVHPVVNEADLKLQNVKAVTVSGFPQAERHEAGLTFGDSPIMNCETSIENSTEFLKNLKGITVSSDEIMVSFEVVSLFTSIPLDLAKQYTEDLLKSCDTDVTAIALLEHLDLCIETNFSFEQQYYQQLKGAPMGSPISGFLAEITMRKLEAMALPLVKP